MSADHTTAIVQQYLNELAGDADAEPIVRALLARAVGRLRMLCVNLLYRSYPRLVQPPVNLQPDEMLSAVVERLLKALTRRSAADGAAVLRAGQPAHALGAE